MVFRSKVRIVLGGSKQKRMMLRHCSRKCSYRNLNSSSLIDSMNRLSYMKGIPHPMISIFERNKISGKAKLNLLLIVQSLMIKWSVARCQRWFPDLNYSEVPIKRIERDMEGIRQRIKQMNQELNKILAKNYKLISLPLRNAKEANEQQLRLLDFRKKVNAKTLQISQHEVLQLQLVLRDMKERSSVIDSNQKMNQYCVEIECLKQQVKQLSATIVRKDKQENQQENGDSNTNKITFQVLHKLKALMFYMNRKGEELQEKLNIIEKNISEITVKDEGVTKKMQDYKKIAEEKYLPVSLNKKGIEIHKKYRNLMAQVDHLKKEVDLEEHNILRTAETLNREIFQIKREEIDYNNRIYTEQSKISCLLAKMEFEISKCKKDQRLIRSVLEKYSQKNSDSNRLPRLVIASDIKQHRSVNGENSNTNSARDKEKKERYFSKTPFKWKLYNKNTNNNKRLNTISNDRMKSEEEGVAKIKMNGGMKTSGEKMVKMLDLVTIKVQNPLLRDSKKLKTPNIAISGPNNPKTTTHNPKGGNNTTEPASHIITSDENQFLQDEFY